MFLLCALLGLLACVRGLRFESDQEGWNLNENQTALDPLDYWGEWNNHTFHPSPTSWRFPFYILTMDRYVDGDPTNNEANGTHFEHDWMSNQFRFGGDTRGLMNHLDYIQGFGIKGLYLSGSPFMNMPWASDGFGPLDLTLLDHHHGMIEDWRALVTEIHRRGMYVLLDNTMATMGDLLAFVGYENETTPFTFDEYDVTYKSDRVYHDFQPGTVNNASCVYPRIWGEDGLPLGNDITDMMHGCKESEFDQYGDMIGVGSVPPAQSQLAKFAGVQDRLRGWRPDVLDKLKHFSCMEIAMLDIDGFRMDKALQTTVDAHAEWSSSMRHCAKSYGKDNFLITGESIGKIPFGSIYFGRGKEPEMAFSNLTEAQLASDTTNSSSYIREFGLSALDGEAFHYPTYGALTRFLGLDGDIGFDGIDFVELWNTMLKNNDMVNAATGKFDPRHMYGVTNQDVFRWPGLANGTHRQNLGFFVTILEMPGIPLLMWGEEQEHKALENIAGNYIFGRSPMASSSAWQVHACYKVGAAGNGYYNLPLDSANQTCGDDSVSLDHRDPSHPIRNIIKRMYEIRQQYPVMNDGFLLQSLPSQLRNLYLPGSNTNPTPTGLWNVYRGRTQGVQNFTDGQGNQGAWLLLSNDNVTREYTCDCSAPTNTSESEVIVAPFPAGTTVKNLFWPYEEIALNASTGRFGIEQSTELNGCLPNLTMPAWGYKAFVPVDKFTQPGPTITKLVPGHDQRIESEVPLGEQQSLPIELEFSREMDCQSVLAGISVQSTTQDGQVMQLDRSSVLCSPINGQASDLVAVPASAWSFTATLTNISHGVHTVTLTNVTTAAGDSSTVAVDRFMFRLGALDNPVVFPRSANYTSGLLRQDQNGSLFYNHTAAGADLWRYSTNWGTTYSNWMPYTGGESLIVPQAWSGTDEQSWYGTHAITQYWGDMIGSSHHVQHTDLEDTVPRRWPHAHFQGDWNQYGYDGGLDDSMTLGQDGWYFDFMDEYPSYYAVNVWGMNPDGFPDMTMRYGDVDGDNILDFLPPNSLAQNTINVTEPPSMPHVGYRMLVNDGSYRYQLQPTGSAWAQVAIFVLLCIIPIFTGSAAVVIFKKSFYKVKFNEIGVTEKGQRLPKPITALVNKSKKALAAPTPAPNGSDEIATEALSGNSRTVLIGTIEYDIEDWRIRIKIGGLGGMAQLMGKSLGHQNLIWVVPCVGGVDYPIDTPAEPFLVTIMGTTYEISVQYHKLRNVTFVLLDSPVFRKQTKAEPYPARMDDLESAVYYSAWNQCIAQTILRFPEIDLYHINDYHGAVAPLYLLPRRIPCCLSLHNAEFQGLWPTSTPKSHDEMCRAFNLDKKVVDSYVQFGEVFNLLHSGASILRKHQNGFGAVGVSRKYGERSSARYPIFWGLKKIGALPNPDPDDTDEFDPNAPKADVSIDTEAEAKRGAFRRQAQTWAGLKIDETAELFVFVGRWSKQKGVDIIADVFPAILEQNEKAQLICVGPVIDLYGKLAAIKLQKLMEDHPGRVYSKPEFITLPACLNTGAEFALIPSRDEPFGLVAVESGRKGALGVGARLGGLGQMPGWWFTVESTATKHMIKQLKSSIKDALASPQQTRALMRARAAVQRFPVVQWVGDLETLQSDAIKMFNKAEEQRKRTSVFSLSPDRETQNDLPSYPGSVPVTAPNSGPPTALASPAESRVVSRGSSRPGSRNPSPTRDVQWQLLHTRLTSIKRNRSSGTTSLNNLGEVSTADFARNGLYPIESRGNNLDQAVESGSSEEDVDVIRPASDSPRFDRPQARISYNETRNSSIASPLSSGQATPVAYGPGFGNSSARASVLSLESVIGDQKNMKLQDVDPSFTDANGFYTNKFEAMLQNLNGKTSEGPLCIEEYIHESEKNWFARFANVKLGKSGASTPTPSIRKNPFTFQKSRSEASDSFVDTDKEQFMLGDNYKPPSGLRKILMTKMGDWPIYALLLAFGQIIAANSYQITLLSGSNGQSANMLYSIASIYLVSSVAWWLLFRSMKSVYVLSLPFLFYGAAFFVLGMAPYGPSVYGRGWIQNAATGLYAIASASGALFFALNFGSEGGTPTRTWIFRACMIQGSQQLYVAGLWFWGAYITDMVSAGVQASAMTTSTPTITAITTPIAVLLWAIGFVLLVGLPDYYRSSPGGVPSFYPSVFRRKIVLWFFVAVVIQNFWMSAPYGRNWRYLWSSNVCPQWAIAIEVIVFFVIIWAVALGILGYLSKEHSWLVPIFAMGLGAPRWCQILWGVSGMGNYLPWAGTQVVGVLVGRGLWLWLGMLDALQGIGFGMILLQTLTRFHITFALIAGQVLGSIATITARAGAPDNVGPGSVFPNLALNTNGLAEPWFWVALGFQLIVPIGFFIFFRKGQLSKP